MSLDLLQVVLVQTRFPENIGMAARACVNMGSHSIRLVAPERWDREKARPLATPKGQVAGGVPCCLPSRPREKWPRPWSGEKR